MEREISLEIFLSFGLITVETFCFLKLANAYFKSKYQEGKTGLLIVLLSNIVSIFVFPAIVAVGIRTEKSILSITFFFIILMIFYNGFWIKKFFLSCIYYILIYAVDYLGTYMALFFSRVSFQELYDSKIGFFMLGCFSKCMLFFVCTVWAKMYRNSREKNHLDFTEWCQLLVIPICMVLNLSIVIYSTIKNDTVSIVLLIDIILMILSIFSYTYVVLKNKMKEEMIQAEIIKKNFNIQRSMTHDFKNHLCILQLLIEDNRTEDALKLLKNLTVETDENMQIVRTGNHFIDAILNYKYTSCRKENVCMMFELNDLSNLSIPVEKIIVILTNLLDNAIEACMELNTERYIKIKFLVGKDVLLSIKNTTNKELVSKNTITTSKENKILHGYGLKNIEKAVKETGGISTINCENGWFQYTILWNCC